MNIDPIISLSYSMTTNKGVYALLIGSGISTGAGIPTGWEIVLDLIEKIAHSQGSETNGKPEDWFVEQYKKAPTYTFLLEKLSNKPSERRNILRGYIEPTAKEVEEGIKLPSAAHKCIASLVELGYVKVIITTNFDRLLETALEEAGITPSVIPNEDAIKGAAPIQHNDCTIIKLHGDYIDTRIKNSEEELSQYDPEMSDYLDRVLDEYGLIICGWSAEWDIALRDAIRRRSNRRYSTYWTSRSQLSGEAKGLFDSLKAQYIPIRDADTFFSELLEKIEAIEKYDMNHPVSVQALLNKAKKYLADPGGYIEFDELLYQESERLYEYLGEKNFPVEKYNGGTQKEFKKRIKKYENATENLRSLLAACFYWNKKASKDLKENDPVKLCLKGIQRIAKPAHNIKSGCEPALNLMHYPTALLIYTSGIASLASHRYSIVPFILTKIKCRVIREDIPAVEAIHWQKLFKGSSSPQIHLEHAKGDSDLALASHIYVVLRESFKRYLPDDDDYDQAFGMFEYLMALTYQATPQIIIEKPSVSIGVFCMKNRRKKIDWPKEILERIIQDKGLHFPLVRTYPFQGLDHFKEIKKDYDYILKRKSY